MAAAFTTALPIFIAVAAPQYYLFNMYSSNEEKYTIEHNNKIQKLESKIDSLHSINKSLTFEIDTLNTKIVALDKEINLQDNKIITKIEVE